MGTRVTNDTNVAIYDSVTGSAFGEVFESEDEAYDFLTYMNEQDGRDPRELEPDDLSKARAAWRELREGPKTQARQCSHQGCGNTFVVESRDYARIFCGQRNCQWEQDMRALQAAANHDNA